uniref:HCO3_cotransp domain-containing protein n=1 Tax=Macrostomum lignano TaxID=282301 RepID=A0A1I8FH19_9PLAT
MADFSLPVSVLAMSFVGTYLFRNAWPFWALSVWQNSLSMLFFMEQNISSAMVNCPANKLRKGSAYHLDLLTCGDLDERSHVLFGFRPGARRPCRNSPLQRESFGRLEERIDLGQHVHQSVVRVRETRITGVVSNVLIGLSLLMCPVPLSFIPVPVLDGPVRLHGHHRPVRQPAVRTDLLLLSLNR